MAVFETVDGKPLPRVGVLGGGQLGRMMANAAHRLHIDVTVLDPKGSESPAGQCGLHTITGSFTNSHDIATLAQHCDVLTFEIEHINTECLYELIKKYPTLQVHPHPSTIACIQDKYIQKTFFARAEHVNVAPFTSLQSSKDLTRAIERYGYPFLVKSRRFAYDGRGNAVIHSESDLMQAFTLLKASKPSDTASSIPVVLPDTVYAEKFVPFIKELAVMVVKSNTGIRTYPVVETVHLDNICHTVIAPARVSNAIAQRARDMARSAIQLFEGNGIFGVELFLNKDDTLYLNEVAPRPHNSGHYTIEACDTDQFEQHLRAVCDLPLGSCELKVECAMMVNVLGSSDQTETSTFAQLRKCLHVAGATAHYYGKVGEIQAQRKLGHFTVVAPSFMSLHSRVTQIDASIPQVASLCVTPLVGIVMGSDSDLPVMKEAAELLEQFEIPFEIKIVSAHRTPDVMYDYAKSAVSRGIKVIIAGAGGAAHLPGMIASLTPLPVIGVPVKTRALHGIDSLLSIVQMPAGIPVATVSIQNAKNAALLAIRILGGDCISKMVQYMKTQRESVGIKAEKMRDVGWKQYLHDM